MQIVRTGPQRKWAWIACEQFKLRGEESRKRIKDASDGVGNEGRGLDRESKKLQYMMAERMSKCEKARIAQLQESNRLRGELQEYTDQIQILKEEILDKVRLFASERKEFQTRLSALENKKCSFGTCQLAKQTRLDRDRALHERDLALDQGDEWQQHYRLESDLRQQLKHEFRKQEEQLHRLHKALQAERRCSINADKLAARIAQAETREYKNMSDCDKPAAKKKLLLKWHPDRAAGDKILATKVSQELNNLF